MRRVVVLGRGGAGKSVFARRLGARTGLPVVELDREFWQGGLRPLSRTGWSAVQARLAAGEEWILDGDLGPYDVLDVRLRRADTVVLLDYSLPRCAWRALRRGRERSDSAWVAARLDEAYAGDARPAAWLLPVELARSAAVATAVPASPAAPGPRARAARSGSARACGAPSPSSC